MTRALLSFVTLTAAVAFYATEYATPTERVATAPLRVALIGLNWPDAAANAQAASLFDATLAEALARDARVVMIDGAQLRPALAGVGYDGSINMSAEDARRLGSAMGCDFFIIGKAETVTRSERENQSHEETLVGLMMVDGRSGQLAVFDLIIEKAATRQSSLDGAAKTLAARASGYIDRTLEFRAARFRIQNPSRSAVDPVEDIPDEGSARSAGFSPPVFLNRVKPEYTPEADLAGISATVEAKVVFRRNAEVGEIEITRWAGFGLDESAVRAIRQLKFKPATRDSHPVSVRAVIRYNFRRVRDF